MKNKELHSEFTFQIEPKHYFKHNYLTYCNDVLVSMLKYADEEKMASVSIDLGNGDYQILFEAAINDGLKIQNRELYQVDRLISLGLLQNQNRLGGNVWLDFVDDPEKQNDIIVTSFGKTFYHNSPAALKRN